MFLDDLASVMRGAGLSVSEVPGWTRRSYGTSGLNSVKKVIIHHTAGAATGDYPSLAVVRDGRREVPGPLAQLGVGRGGTIYVIAAGLANHAGVVLRAEYGNAYSIGIEVESVGTGPVWPYAQVHAAARAAAALCRRYGLAVQSVMGHKEVCYPVGRKVDPVGIPGGMPEFRAMVNHYIHNPEEEDMDQAQNDALSAIYRTVVGVNDPEGPLWQGTNLATQLGFVVTQIEESTLQATEATNAALKAAQAATAASTASAAVLEKVEQIAVGGVDLDALAKKVADLLDQRARDDDPSTGPRT